MGITKHNAIIQHPSIPISFSHIAYRIAQDSYSYAHILIHFASFIDKLLNILGFERSSGFIKICDHVLQTFHYAFNLLPLLQHSLQDLSILSLHCFLA